VFAFPTAFARCRNSRRQATAGRGPNRREWPSSPSSPWRSPGTSPRYVAGYFFSSHTYTLSSVATLSFKRVPTHALRISKSTSSMSVFPTAFARCRNSRRQATAGRGPNRREWPSSSSWPRYACAEHVRVGDCCEASICSCYRAIVSHLDLFRPHSFLTVLPLKSMVEDRAMSRHGFCSVDFAL
jgi:hypothetical protein